MIFQMLEFKVCKKKVNVTFTKADVRESKQITL